MNDSENPPHRLTADEVALETELHRLRPVDVSSTLREEMLATLTTSSESSEEQAFAQHLHRHLRPASPPADLWKAIDARLDHEAAPQTNVVELPRWRDFTPIFKVAALVAIGVFASSIFLRTTPAPTASVTPDGLSGQKNELPSGQFQPISRSGVIQNTQRVGFLEKDKQVYETQLQTRRDNSLYQLDRHLRVEDEVTRQGQVITPIRTF